MNPHLDQATPQPLITLYSEGHHQHHGQAELKDGQLVPCFEKPARADMILAQLREAHLGAIKTPEEVYPEVQSHWQQTLAKVHSQDYIDFLANAWREWSAAGHQHDMLPLAWPPRRTTSIRIPDSLDGRLGYYSFDAGAPINAGTWPAITDTVQVAIAAAELLHRQQSHVFALTRPPGHHAGRDYMGGYCYFNNAAVAAQHLLDRGAQRIALLDVDFHHGNGTQDIFYARDDVLFQSIHGDPRACYPGFTGYADETGEGPGKGFNQNYPLLPGSDWSEWSQALALSIIKINHYAADALVLSLGVDTFEGDPISHFKLKSEDYIKMGQRIAEANIPVVVIMEGGYAVEEIGLNTRNLLIGLMTPPQES
ncbi:histone deacetylase family protein [Terasakiispira papahanaumokuakeensis]|uniref:histone deacetylase family protein n=1 Tax=Terasakiispira papahanaumokuakeensis TaxID=197479 RepID=UPI0024811383|nr:histone deacetylase family protein [Terasakiispira papahanaumokuakeensis]